MSESHEDNPEHNPVEHERTDISLSGIAIVAVVSVVILIVSLVLLDGMFVLWVEKDKQEYVYSVPSSELREIRSLSTEKLTRFAVIDADKDVYQVPINHAMKLIADEAYAQRGK